MLHTSNRGVVVMPDELKREVKKFLDFLDENGTIEETGQTYKKVHIKTLFDIDREMLYTIIENLKTLSK